MAGLELSVDLVSSSRMRVSLGRYVSTTRQIRIASFVLDGPHELLLEVVCHEFAHAAVHRKFGRACQPHGPEWRAFMGEAEDVILVPELDERGPADLAEDFGAWAARSLAPTSPANWNCGH